METWGLMNKSQTDSELVEAAISRIVQAHDDDPEAHLGALQSLSTHRENDVLDHPAGSVLADKATRSEFSFYTDFSNPAVFSVVGTPQFTFPGFVINGEGSNFATRWGVGFSGGDNNLNLDFNKDFQITFSFTAVFPDTGVIKLRFGYPDDTDTVNGVGLEIIDDVANFYVAKEDKTSKSQLAWPTFSDGENYIVTLQYVASEAMLYVYINGELLGTLTYPAPTTKDNLQFQIYAYDTAVLNVYDLRFAMTVI